MGQGRKPHPSTAGQQRGVWSQPDLVELLDCSPVLTWARGTRERLTSILHLLSCVTQFPTWHIKPFAADTRCCQPLLPPHVGSCGTWCHLSLLSGDALFMALCSPPNSPLPHRRVSELQGHFYLGFGLLEGKIPEGESTASVRSRASPQTLDSTALALSSFHSTMCAPTPVQTSQAFSTIQHSHCETSPQLQGVGPCGCSLRVGTPQPLLLFLLLR